MTNTIVTGASGFIGTHLLRKLNGSVLVLEHDEIGIEYDAERCFFLSTYGNMSHHIDGKMIVKANVEDLITILSYFTGWICFMSSSSVMLPVQTLYSRTKKASEEILMSFPGIKSCIVRPYSVTGIGEQEEHLIPTLIRSCMEGEEMPFDPWPVHDFIDVEDVVDGLIWLSDEQKTGIHEFGYGIPYTNQEVKELVEFACDRKANIKPTRQLRPYDTSTWYCRDYNRPWKPKKPLSKSISEMVEAYKREYC